MLRTGQIGAVVGTAILICAPLLVATAAHAHNFVVSSTPTAEQVLTELPEQWVVTTNDDLLDLGGDGAGFALVATDAAGDFFGDGCVEIDGPSVTSAAALGEPGDYTLLYQFISADGHTLSGEIAFSWLPEGEHEPHIGLDAPPVCGETASAPAPEPTAEPGPTLEPGVDETVAPAEPENANEALPVAGAIALIIALVAAALAVAVILARRPQAMTAEEADTGSVAYDATDGPVRN